MQVYRHTEKNFLLFAPFLCGSSYIRQNAEKMKLVRIEEQNWRLQLSLVQAYFPHVENRFVLFRDPFQKIVSFFSKFVYAKKYGVYFNTDVADRNEIAMDFWKKFEDWLPNMLEHKNDLHMQSITEQLGHYGLLDQLDQFTVVPNRNYMFWLNQHLDDPIRDYVAPLSRLPVNSYIISQIMTIREQIREIYHEDYEFLRKATFEWKTIYTEHAFPFMVIDEAKTSTSDEENFYDDFVPEFPDEIEDLPAQHREEIDAPVEVEIETPAPTPVVKPVVRTTNTNRRRRRNR